MRQSRLEQQVVEYIPEQLLDGVLYVSHRYGTAVHKCCCGCGEEVITPLSSTDWSIRIVGNNVTLHPSVGNWSFACQSHYFIKNSRVVWAGQMSQEEIELGRARDLRQRNAFFTAAKATKHSAQEISQSSQSDNKMRLSRLVVWIRKKFKRPFLDKDAGR
jgi:Family of unknown function (DUF6527)